MCKFAVHGNDPKIIEGDILILFEAGFQCVALMGLELCLLMRSAHTQSFLWFCLRCSGSNVCNPLAFSSKDPQTEKMG